MCYDVFYCVLILIQSRSESHAHLLPFIMPAAEGELASLYGQVNKVMTAVHNKKGGSVEAFKRLAADW